MCGEVDRRRDGRVRWRLGLASRPLLFVGHPIITLSTLLSETVPANDLEMIPFSILCRGGRLHGPGGAARQWLEVRLVEDLARGEVLDRSPWPMVGFTATTMIPQGCVDALEVWTDAVAETVKRTCDLLDIYHGFLPESVIFDTYRVSEVIGKLIYEDPHRAAGQILRERVRRLYDPALHAAAASQDWPMVLEVVRRLARDRRAHSVREHLIVFALRAWLRMGNHGEALRVAQRAMVDASCESANLMFRTALAACHAALGQWKRVYAAVEGVPAARQPRAAYHRMVALLHLGKLEEAKTERQHYFDHAGTDLYADFRFRSLAKRLLGVTLPREI